MNLIDPRSFCPGEIFREKEFREAVRAFDWSQYQGKPVLIEGCASITLPTWAYLVITAQLAPYAKSISYGELRSPIPIIGKLGVTVDS